jgi:hypothetical protein
MKHERDFASAIPDRPLTVPKQLMVVTEVLGSSKDQTRSWKR